jgi:hypothetical protein
MCRHRNKLDCGNWIQVTLNNKEWINAWKMYNVINTLKAYTVLL